MEENHIADELKGTDSPPQEPDSKSRWRRCGCVLLGAIIFLFIAGLIGFRLFFKSQFTPDQWEIMKSAETTVLQLPPEWHKPATLPPLEVVQFAKEFSLKTKAVSTSHSELLFGDYSTSAQLLTRMRTGDTLTASEETSLVLFMADMQPLIDMTSAAVAIPGYSVELDLYTAQPGMEFLHHQQFAKFASIVALELARQDKTLQAVETAILPLRVMKRPAQASLISHLISIAVSSIQSHTLSALADGTSDTSVLSRELAFLDEVRPLVFPGEIEQWRYSDSLGALGFAAANGYPADLTPQPYIDIIGQSSSLYNGQYYQWIIKHLPAQDLRVHGARARLDQLRQPTSDYDEVFKLPAEQNAPPTLPAEHDQDSLKLEDTDTTKVPALYNAASKLLFGVHPHAILLALADTNYDETETRARIAIATYDLTRLHIAARVAELKGQQFPENQDSLLQVPFSDSTPLDPFTSKPFHYNTKSGLRYSVGPDQTDNNAAVRYDATNGTMSAGDIWIAEKASN